ncbi:MDR family MFS transporter [Paenibacillus chungangensis]|uniref:MDR family MFS transporter n=1 Tax=Paenibacillus chungangensis TaxID=696535 RepID=A0ABW3HQ07_9BACL
MQNVHSRRNITIALFVVTFLAAIEGTIVGTAMPSITKELYGVQQYSWIISIYLLAVVITTPIYGKLADLYGRKKILIAGAGIFLLGSMLSGIAGSMDQLIWFRAVQGLGAGALTTLPYTIIGDMYDFERRAKVQGWLASIWGIAGITGPLFGGLLVDFVSWRAIFYMNLPFGIVALYLLSVSMKSVTERKKRYIDYPGIIAFTIGMYAFLYAMSLLRGDEGGTTSVVEIGLWFAGSALFLLLFAWIERRSPEPIIPIQLFRHSIINMANASGFVLCVIMVVIVFYVPLWIQGVGEKSATYSGMAMIPLSITWPLGSILAGNYISRIGLKRICLAAACLLLLGTIGFTFIHASSPILVIVLCTAVVGLSFGLIFTSLTVAVTSAVGWEMRGAATAGHNFVRTLGQTIGITLFGLLLHTGEANLIEPQVLEESLHGIFLWVAGLSVAIMLLATLMPNIRRDEDNNTSKHDRPIGENAAGTGKAH